MPLLGINIINFFFFRDETLILIGPLDLNEKKQSCLGWFVGVCVGARALSGQAVRPREVVRFSLQPPSLS